jgi:hypothetical protein
MAAALPVESAFRLLQPIVRRSPVAVVFLSAYFTSPPTLRDGDIPELLRTQQ